MLQGSLVCGFRHNWDACLRPDCNSHNTVTSFVTHCNVSNARLGPLQLTYTCRSVQFFDPSSLSWTLHIVSGQRSSDCPGPTTRRASCSHRRAASLLLQLRQPVSSDIFHKVSTSELRRQPAAGRPSLCWGVDQPGGHRSGAIRRRGLPPYTLRKDVRLFAVGADCCAELTQ